MQILCHIQEGKQVLHSIRMVLYLKDLVLNVDHNNTLEPLLTTNIIVTQVQIYINDLLFLAIDTVRTFQAFHF